MTIICSTSYIIFRPLYIASEVNVFFAIHPFNICTSQPELWKLLKILFIITLVFSQSVICIFIIHNISILFNKKNKNLNITDNSLHLTIGKNKKGEIITISEKGLYQYILITGTIGSGKTSSAMYPFTKQLISYRSFIPEEKLGMLILDVKGNYHTEVYKYCKMFDRLSDYIVIDLSRFY